jgi:hypothetical protein
MSTASGKKSREASMIPKKKTPTPPSVAKKITMGLTSDFRRALLR